jgi:ArsR family transcriptional regulator, lead/cadmium/zinc/bismuth-responsive transcriptional repressor
VKTSEKTNPEKTNPEKADTLCEVQCLHPEAVAKARAAIPDLACVNDASTLLKMIADPTRLRILSALTASELCVCDIAASVGLSESAASHQLRLLREHRLVSHHKEGRVVYYRLNDAHVTDLISSAVEHARETR